VLPRLVTAFEQVRAGKAPSTPDSAGNVIYHAGGFSFLMRPIASYR
jgi:hypothetical protein